MTDTDQPHARLFDYFIACGLQQKQSYNNSNNKHHRNHRRKKLSPNSPDIPWQPVILYVYNANKIVSSSTSSTSPMTPTTPLSPSTPFSEQNIDHQLTEKEKLEESEVLLQVPRYCYCDLSDLINRYNSNNLKISKYNDNNKSSTHNVQFEKFSFVFRRSDGNQMYGHCRRILQQDLLPSSLCIVSSYNFTKLFEQIMDNIITKWIFDDHNSIFIFLNNILTYNNCIPPSIGDTFRVSLNDNNCPNNLYQNKSTNSSQDELNNMITLKLESTNRQNLKILFKRLSIDNILFLISCILTEQKLIFISSKLEILSECIYGLVSLIYPFKWQYLLCPILTEKYLNFFTTPLPFIIGIKRYLANYYRSIDKKKSNIVVIDLDKQNILSSTRKFKHLPNKPCWKLKRELNRIIKKFEYLMYDINDFKISIQQNTMNNKYRYIPSNDIIKTGKNKDKQNKQNMKKTKKHRRKPSESSTNLRLLLQKEMTYDIAKGWDDTPFYNAFLSFFIVFIGDWKKFYDEKNPLTPKTPYHLKNIKKNKKKLQQNDKNDKNYGLKQIFYSQEALEYLDKLLQTQLFQTWYIRQRKESQNGEIKLYGVQDIYDFALKNSDKFGGLSYTGCYDYLSITFNSLNKKLVKYVIDTVFEFTENTDCTRNTNMIDLMISCASSEPYTFNSIINIINYRLYNILDNNYQNHSFALMSFYLLMKLMEQSTEKIIMHCIDKYIYFAFILNKYYINDNNVIKKQMKHITNKFIQLTTNINELKRIRSNNNNNNNTTNSPKPILNLLDLFQWNQENDDKESHIVATNVKLSVIAFKLSTYDFSDLHMETMDHDEKLLLLNQVMTPPKNIHSYHIFTKMSQYQPINAQEYRKRATKQEVNVIPPFIHLHQQFAIDIDIDQNSFIQETKQDNDEYNHDNDDNVSFQRLHQVAPINSNTHNIMSPEIDVISPRKHATASIWELPHVDIPKQHSHALQESTSISIQSLTPTPPPNNSNYKSIDMNLDELNNLAIDGSLTNIKKTRKKKKKRSNSRKKEKREKKEKKEKKKIITPPMINVDLNNTAKKVKWVIDTKHDVEEQDDMEYEYEPSADSTELDMTPQPTEPYYMIDKFKNPNNSKHVIQGSDPEQSYDVMTLGSGDDANEEVVDDLEHIPITKFNDDGISVKSYKSAKTSKWEEESLDLDSIRGNSLSRHSMHEQAQHLSQQSSLNKHESSPLDIADDNNEHEHKQNEHVIEDNEDNDDKVNMNININISDEYSHKQHNTQTTTLTHVSCDSSPIDVNMSPPNIMFQQV